MPCRASSRRIERPAGRTSHWAARYTPLIGDVPFRQRGMASWYGRQFHGNRTANGEIYDMFGMTAAHPILPLPSYVRVTNVRTGRSVIVRVNDRGPFKHDRVIDLSYAAATKLGIAAAGTGEVEVERITMAQIASGEYRRGESGAARSGESSSPVTRLRWSSRWRAVTPLPRGGAHCGGDAAGRQRRPSESTPVR